MIFVTVGTQFPFDRLIKAVDVAAGKGLFREEVFAQIGESDYVPENFDFAKTLEKARFDELVDKASVMISHAGMGTITIALANHKPLLVMPRLKKYGEAVNDHQLDITRHFEDSGYLMACYEPQQVIEKISSLGSFKPKVKENSHQAVSRRVLAYLSSI